MRRIIPIMRNKKVRLLASLLLWLIALIGMVISFYVHTEAGMIMFIACFLDRIANRWMPCQ